MYSQNFTELILITNQVHELDPRTRDVVRSTHSVYCLFLDLINSFYHSSCGSMF